VPINTNDFFLRVLSDIKTTEKWKYAISAPDVSLFSVLYDVKKYTFLLHSPKDVDNYE
jgi:hypothetical protein